jgi:C-terminal processing protease CtpA/Prc
MENQGVTPDIEVANLPQDAAKGIDTQMDRAIKEVLMLHAQNPPIKAAFGPEPPKSRAAFREREMGSR